MVASVADALADWMEVPSNSILCITPNMNVLQCPILDEYHNASHDTQSRNPEFAKRTGFHAQHEKLDPLPTSAAVQRRPPCFVQLEPDQEVLDSTKIPLRT